MITVSCQLDNFIRNPSNHRNQKNPYDHSQPHILNRYYCKKSYKKYNTDNNNKKQKAGSTAFMKPGAFHNIFHRKRHSMFHTVNTLMLSSMIHKYPLDILHFGNQKKITQKQTNPYCCLCYGNHSLCCPYLLQKTGNEIRQYHE